MSITLVLTVVLVALVFEYINGFHDTANSIATVVATKVLSPGQAVLLAAATNLLGALWGTAVAKTISSGLIDAVYQARTQLAMSDGMRIAINVIANGYHIQIGDMSDPTDLYLSTGCIWRVCQGLLRVIDHIAPVEAN